MKGGYRAKGFTIVETLIVLAVTGALFISAMALIGGQQAKTEFSQSVRELDSKIRDLANDVTTGNYSIPAKYSCAVSGGTLTILPSATDTLGNNKDCLFIGKVLQPGYGADRNILRIYTVAGRRLKAAGGDVTNLNEATPQSMGAGSYMDTKLEGGLMVGRVTYDYGVGGGGDIDAFGFFTTFPTAAASGNGLTSGSSLTDIYPLIGTLPAPSPSGTTGVVETVIANLLGAIPKNPTITVCVLSGGTDQHATITIGGSGGNGQLTTKLDIQSGKVCS